MAKAQFWWSGATIISTTKVAVLTGPSGGIGSAILQALVGKGFKVYGIGRTIAEQSVNVLRLKCDLTINDDLDNVVDLISRNTHVNVLIHAAGVFYQGKDFLEVARQHTINVAAPYYLSRGLSGRLAESQGQVIFLNSRAAFGSKRPNMAQYATTKKALKDVADRLRVDLNPMGVRVTSLFLGQVATEMQRKNYEMEGWEYKPESLMQPEDVAEIVLDILNLPHRAEITDITLRSTQVSAA